MPHYLQNENPDLLRAASTLAVFVEQAFRKAKAHPDMSPFEFTVLRLVAQFDPNGITAPDIARTFDVNISSVTTVLSRELQRGLITWEFPENSKKNRLVRLTQAGWSLLGDHDPLQAALVDLFGKLTAEELRQLFDMLIRLDPTQQRWRDLKHGIDFWR